MFFFEIIFVQFDVCFETVCSLCCFGVEKFRKINSHNIPGVRSFYEICAMKAKFTPDSAFFFLLNEIMRIGSTPTTPINCRDTIG